MIYTKGTSTNMRTCKSTGDLGDIQMSIIPKSKSLSSIELSEKDTEKTKDYLQLVVVEPYETKFQQFLREKKLNFSTNDKDMELLRSERPVSKRMYNSKRIYQKPNNDLTDLFGIIAPLMLLFILIVSEIFSKA